MSKKTAQKEQAKVQQEQEQSTDKLNEEAVQEEAAETTEQPEEKADTTPQDELTTLKEKNAELNDRYIRLYSEFDNYRRRTIKEKSELHKSAASDTISSLLPVVDDFDRATNAFETTDSVEALKEGIILIHNKLNGILKQKGLEEIKAMGEVFDTDYHEAITRIPVPDKKMKDKVLDVTEKGYTLNGKVIRYAKVVVGS